MYQVYILPFIIIGMIIVEIKITKKSLLERKENDSKE